MIREDIQNAVRAALTELGAPDIAFTIERPGDLSHGDYSTNAALIAAKKLGKNPTEVAKLVIEKLPSKNSSGSPQNVSQEGSLSDAIEKIEVAGPGFVNFFLSRESVAEVVRAAKDSTSGKNDIYKGKTILVEYTSPNLFKPLHIGNLVGNILGESISRILAASGADIKRVNYPSDIGLTVAKGVWGLWKNHLDANDIAALGRAYVLGNAAYEDGSGKAEIEEINRALYADSNPEWSKLREQGIATSKRHLDAICKKLGTTFDSVFFESQSGPLGREIVSSNVEKVFEVSEGATVFHGAHTRVFLNSQGLPTYEAKEVGLFELKSLAYPGFDISITVTGSEQKDFFAVVFDAVRKIFPDRTQGKELLHIANGFLRLTTGKMSSRLGNVITGESLLADLERDAKEKMAGREVKNAQEVAEAVAVSAIKYTVLKQGNGKDIIFDPEKSLSLEGDSGPYVQYAHVRALSLLRKAQEARETLVTDYAGHNAPDVDLGRIILHFPDAVRRAAEEMQPHHLVTYITELSAAFNSWYGIQRVIINGEILSIHLSLVRAVENTLKQGLDMLGIAAPEEM